MRKCAKSSESVPKSEKVWESVPKPESKSVKVFLTTACCCQKYGQCKPHLLQSMPYTMLPVKGNKRAD